MNILVFTGAGISAESGLKTFRDCADGMWNDYKIEEVCSVEALENNLPKVLEFYTKRRLEASNVKPNAAHYALAELENIIMFNWLHKMLTICMNYQDHQMLYIFMENYQKLVIW